jgi:hypothetical protein
MCIDQSNDAEKGTQIPLMTQIFRKAKRVLAWVGGAQQEEEGMRHLNMLSRESRQVVTSDMRAGFEDVILRRPFAGIDNIRRFLHLPWFSRLWIIQEIVFNTDITLICRTTEISWTRMCSALLIIHQTRPGVVIALDSVEVEALLKIT